MSAKNTPSCSIESLDVGWPDQIPKAPLSLLRNTRGSGPFTLKGKKMAKEIVSFLLVCLLLTGVLLSEEPLGGPATPLDLPSGGASSDDEEDIGEVIEFYGAIFEGDAFFWCLDRSCSMGWGGRLPVLKSEFSTAIDSLSDESEFSAIHFGSSFNTFSHIPLEANLGNREAAKEWINQVEALGGTCLAPAGVALVNISQLSDKDNKVILVLSDGVPGCGGTSGGPSETLTAITSANWERTPINTIYISTDNSGIAFMQALATMNGGTFSQASQ